MGEIVIVILVAITIDRRRSRRWLGVWLLLGKFGSTVQRILVQFGLLRDGGEHERDQRK